MCWHCVVCDGPHQGVETKFMFSENWVLVSPSNVCGGVCVPVNVMPLKKPSNVFIVVITRSAGNDKRQESLNFCIWKPTVYGSHFASWLRQVSWASPAQGPNTLATPQVCRCYRLVSNVRIWYGIALKVFLVCVRRFCFCSVCRPYVASNTQLTWLLETNNVSHAVCMFIMSCIFMYVYISRSLFYDRSIASAKASSSRSAV